ncbi:glutamate synthase subunit beta [Haliangium ochraceum]|uniref:Glutamate synthase, NADH/NADPH, small subunit n=1 Tax=Haliangium ochraceum (strain DSM 14365 / JCM 11303 / SMP-2) TaxID=502025 RepID=D0LT41_HALO1|nr:glutamate synthase subunit beta [Haliangium ochraceum]ACY19177.1 glutamate synthase, NADH/NADPH, small subunit [Haliangium ochraceum DSM 14365]
MGKSDGFKQWRRELPDKRPVDARLKDYREFYLPRAPEAAQAQGGRCMDCGVPFCTQGCPLGNHIPDWNDAVYRDRWQTAYERLSATNNFPEFTGRLCPAPCEAACVLAINDDAVTIEQIEKDIVERAFAEGWVQARTPRQRTGRHVGIVGSGPAGLAAAAQLNHAGHQVTVYESAAKPGGLLRYGIPDFKMEKWVVDRRLAVLEAEGVSFLCNVRVGEDLRWDDVAGRHDALLIAMGAQVPRDLPVPGRELSGVHFAMDYLTQQNQSVSGEQPDLALGGGARIDAAGKRVVILGGGDTGSDCLGTALRQGAASVHQIELLPAPDEMRADRNPWPQWPMVFRTSSSQEEGGERRFALMTKKLSGEGGALAALHLAEVEVQGKPGGGFELREHEDKVSEIPADLLLLAMGFTGPRTGPLVEQLGVKLDSRGNVATDGGYQTSVSGVFAAGDARRGQSLIVWAIAEGREAARTVDAYLRGTDEDWLPTRGRDCHFGGR